MKHEYTAIIKKEDDWWIGWIEEIPGVNCQEKTYDELKDTLEVTLKEALELNRQDALIAAGIGRYWNHLPLKRYGYAMNIWDADKLVLFIAFVIPGFISIKTYDLLVPSERREVGKSLVDVVAYSCINYSLLLWLILLDYKYQWGSNYPAWHVFLVSLILFVFPILWGSAFVWLRKRNFFTKYAPHPIPKPWDYVFGNDQVYWVVIELSDGEIIGGMYDRDSFASSYPAEEQLYLQQLWEIGENDKFVRPLERSRGAIVSANEIKLIRFYQ